MTSASSVTSAEVGPFIFNPTANAAIWDGCASPLMIWSIAQPDCPRDRFCPSVRRPRTSGQLGAEKGAAARWSPDDPPSYEAATSPMVPRQSPAPNRPPGTPGPRQRQVDANTHGTNLRPG